MVFFFSFSVQPSFPGECPRVLGFGAGERALAALSVFFANSRWLRIGHARLAFFWWFCVGRGLRTCVGHVRVGCVLRKRVGRFSTNLRRAHIGHLASCVFFVNLRWARVGGLALAICALDGVGDSRWIIFR